MTKKDPELAPDFLPEGNGKGNFLKKVPLSDSKAVGLHTLKNFAEKSCI